MRKMTRRQILIAGDAQLSQAFVYSGLHRFCRVLVALTSLHLIFSFDCAGSVGEGWGLSVRLLPRQLQGSAPSRRPPQPH